MAASPLTYCRSQVVRKVQDLVPEMKDEEIQRGRMMCTYDILPSDSGHCNPSIASAARLATTSDLASPGCRCYPGAEDENAPCGRGGPCNYVKHCDNPDKNGRRLTALFYLNPVSAENGADS